MKVISNPQDLKFELTNKTSIGFVPTMGGLHEGHFSLIKKCRDENKVSVVSLFLNPTQFDSAQDLETYPSSLEQDLQNLESIGIDYLFLPNQIQIYPDNFSYQVQESQMSQELCGANRPGHFTGVLTVVMKLLNIVKPTKAYFGEKDFQQLELIRGMVDAFFMDVEIVSAAIVRDDNGLALSSRNRRLNEKGLKKAQLFAKLLSSDENLDSVKEKLKYENIEVDYLVEKFNRRFGAVKIDQVRLIDNVRL